MLTADIGQSSNPSWVRRFLELKTPVGFYRDEGARDRATPVESPDRDVRRGFPVTDKGREEEDDGEEIGTRPQVGSRSRCRRPRLAGQDYEISTSDPRFQHLSFCTGMIRLDAEGEIARLGLATMKITHPDVRYLIGNTPDGFEIMLMFRKERLAQLTILQPGHSKIIDARQAFWKERTEKQRQQRELANTRKRITENDDAMLLAWAKHCQS
jgi:hypothetical protein